ncbi:hypothetical protein HK096_001047 [Nowakowskiella sp. JEL0078]|nr:hypothetical protein HK096_001047 [Nowakowskiella sp. JEL0078]
MSATELKSVLKRIHTFFFQQYLPLAQYTALKNPQQYIPHIATAHPSQRAQAQLQWIQFAHELSSLEKRNLSDLELTILSETRQSVDIFVKDEEHGWGLLNENFMSGVYTNYWQYAVLEGKLLLSLGGLSKFSRESLLHVYKITPTWLNDQLECWRSGATSSWVMSQGCVEQTVTDLREKYAESDLLLESQSNINVLKKSRYYEFLVIDSNKNLVDLDLESKQEALVLIQNLIQSWEHTIEFLENEYLPIAKQIRPHSKPGLNALGSRGDTLYKHLIKRFVGMYHSPEETAELGERMTKDLQNVMVDVGKRHYQIESYEQVSCLLVNELSSVSHIQNFTGEKVKEYLFEESKIIKAALKSEFNHLPVCDFDIRLFKSAGVAYYVMGRVNHDKPSGSDGYCIEHGVYYAGVPTLDSEAIFPYPKDDISLLMHEAIPGHHFQQQIAIESREIYDLMGEGLQESLTADQSGFVEGWALYAEALGFRLGLYNENQPMRILRHHNNNMLRTLRLWLDSRLNTGTMDREEAVTIMSANGFSRDYAEFEVDRYTGFPGHALGYMRGRLVLDKLRANAEEKLGASFVPGEFHDVVLRHGTISLGQMKSNVKQYVENKLK